MYLSLYIRTVRMNSLKKMPKYHLRNVLIRMYVHNICMERFIYLYIFCFFLSLVPISCDIGHTHTHTWHYCFYIGLVIVLRLYLMCTDIPVRRHISNIIIVLRLYLMCTDIPVSRHNKINLLNTPWSFIQNKEFWITVRYGTVPVVIKIRKVRCVVP